MSIPPDLTVRCALNHKSVITDVKAGARASGISPIRAIYYFYPAFTLGQLERAEHFRRAAAMGFDSVLMDCADAPPEDPTDWFTETAAAAANTNLRLLADFDGAERTGAWLTGAQAAGVAGFRCLSIDKRPAGWWAALIAAAKQRDPAARFMAWTPGLAPEAIAAVAGAGFDHAFSSSAWWDFKAGWLNEDAARIAAIGPAIAMTEPPQDFRCGDLDAEGAASRRALQFAAVYAPVLLVPMGFEYGAGSWLGRLSGDAPAAFARLQSAPAFDLSTDIAAVNADHAQGSRGGPCAKVVSYPGSAVALLERPQDGLLTIIANPSLAAALEVSAGLLLPQTGTGRARFRNRRQPAGEITPASHIRLAPGEVALLETNWTEPVVFQTPRLDTKSPRLAIEHISPIVDQGEFPVRRILGELVEIGADILADGHDKLAAELQWRYADAESWQTAPMELVTNDRWRAALPLDRIGRYSFRIVAWWDEYATGVDHIAKKHAAGVPIALDVTTALSLIENAAREGRNGTGPALAKLLRQLRNTDEAARVKILLSGDVMALMRLADPRRFEIASREVMLEVERRAAAFANWYEVFPRSQSGDVTRHGTFRDVIRRLPAIRDMGFDVLYFPPIHPIGRLNRKGRNNSLTPAPADPGSPYAIGSSEGGHTAIHPELGSFEDFDALVAAAPAFGIEIALDLAIQCAPDHPWITEHPEWFDWQADGSLRYAENPPKKYEDIVNVDFYARGAQPSLWLALRDAVEFWVGHGIKIFRVDNPHTKPFPFWHWLTTDIRSRHPEVLFLAEAFTRPKIMYRLAKVGFSQSYTYFTWRHSKAEFTAYLTEMSEGPVKEYFRPNFFVNTPDINPPFLQVSGRPGFLIRAALAATLSGLWGVYNGFELCESTPIPGKEEYLNSEKYEIRAWDYDRVGNIIPEISQLNRLRREHSALQSHLGIEFLQADNDAILYFLKTAGNGDAVLVAINLDPFHFQESLIDLPMAQLGWQDDAAVEVHDLFRGNDFTLYGRQQRIRLDPFEIPFHIWQLQHSPAAPMIAES